MNITSLSYQLNLDYRRKYPSTRQSKNLPTAIYMTDEERTPNPIETVKCLPRGAGVILRHYGHPQRSKLAQQLQKISKKKGLVFLIAKDLKLARRYADGCHLPEHACRNLPAKIKLGKKTFLITGAAHNRFALAKGQKLGLDACLYSPVFATKSHEDQRGMGIVEFATACQMFSLPIYALGGISETTLKRLKHSRGAGIAGIGCFEK